MGVIRLACLLVALAAVGYSRDERVERQVSLGGCSQLADVMFLYDGSDSMTREDYRQEQAFIINIIRGLSLDPIKGIRAGAVVFDSGTQAVRLDPFRNHRQLSRAINALPHEQGGTLTHKGIEVIREIFRSEGRSNIPHILVLLTDGRSKNGTATLEQAFMAKREGIMVISIGIGTKIDDRELGTVASRPELFLRVENFDALQDLTLNISKRVCPTTTTTTTTTTTPYPANPCDDCRFSNGVAFAAHETECYLFYHCVGVTHPGSTQRLRPYVKRCPWNQFWDQNDLTCKPANEVDCQSDRCKERGVTAYGMTTSCRGYWECDFNRTMEAGCCGINERFVEGQGCIPDSTCKDQCPYVTKDYVAPTCTGIFKTYPLDETKYLYGGGVFECPLGLAFSSVDCWCSQRIAVNLPANDAGVPLCMPDIHLPFDNNFADSSPNRLSATPQGRVRIVKDPSMAAVGGGAAKFDGGKVTIWKYANDDFRDVFAIKFRYFDVPLDHLQSNPEAIVSNSGCRQQCTIAVTFDRGQGLTESLVTTTKSGRRIADIPQASSGSWKDVDLRYNGTAITLRVDGEIKSTNSRGNVLKANAALQLGNSCAEFSSFYGYIDEFKVFKGCLPPVY